MKILSIETSCDETAISIVDAGSNADSSEFNVLANIVLSQAKLHAEYGGVFPNLAKREHSKNLVPVLKQALGDSKMIDKTLDINLAYIKELVTLLEREPDMLAQFLEWIPTIKKPAIDAIAVTNGPGLEPALWVGVNFAKALSLVWNIPIIPINHMEGHILAAILQNDETTKFRLKEIKVPAIALLISGGHTELVLVSSDSNPDTDKKDWMNYEIIGQTRDDAIGEAFDKVARMLGLQYPGGPEISKLAQKANKKEGSSTYTLPRPMIKTDDFDFSFSGLKTAVLYMVKKLPKLTKQIKEEIALEFEEAVTDVLLQKTFRAIEKYQAKTIIIGGGVSANTRIRNAFKEKVKEMNNIELFIPDNTLSTDNALMIAVAGYLKSRQSVKAEKIKANGNLKL